MLTFAIVIAALLLAVIAIVGLARAGFNPATFMGLAALAVCLLMVACASACPYSGQLNTGCVQQVQQYQQLQYAPIVAPVAQAFVAPVVQQYYAPPVQQFVAPPVYSAPVVQQFRAGYSAQLNVAPVAALKTRQVTRTRAIRIPRRSKVVTSQIVAPAAVVAPVVGY